jgi:hypothetical protein
MPRIRIATAGASFLFFLAVTLGSAAAQYEATGPVGKPLPLLQFTQHKVKARLPPHPKLAVMAAKKKKVFRERIARHIAAKPHRAIVDAGPASAPLAYDATPENSAMPENSVVPENSWPTASAGPPDAMPTLAPDRPPPSVTTESTVNADPDQIVTGGHSVQAALPNGLDQAAPPAAPVKAQAKTQVKTTATASAASAPAVHAMVVRAEPRNTSAPSPIGSASWIEHVLAALGGAITAGAVAWFLIKPAPERNYG